MDRELLLATSLVVGAFILVAAAGSVSAHDQMECTNSHEAHTPHPTETCVQDSSSITITDPAPDAVMEPRRVTLPEAHDTCEMWFDNANRMHGSEGELFSPSFLHTGQYQDCVSDLEGTLYDELENPP